MAVFNPNTDANYAAYLSKRGACPGQFLSRFDDIFAQYIAWLCTNSTTLNTANFALACSTSLLIASNGGNRCGENNTNCVF